MRRRLFLLLLLLLPIAWGLDGCGWAPAPHAAPAAATTVSAPAQALAGSTPALTEVVAPARGPSPATSHTPTRRPYLSPSPTPSSRPTALATAFSRPTASPNPTLPALATPQAGEPLPLSLGWRLDANGHLTAAGILDMDGQPVFVVASLGRTVYALTSEGQLAWRQRTGGPAYALAVLDAQRLAMGDDAGLVTLFDADGRQLWRHDLGSRVTALHAAWQAGVLAGGWDERLSLLDDDGQVRWQADLVAALSSIAVLPNLAAAATVDGQIQAFDPAGAEIWRFDVGTPILRIGTFEEGQATRLLLSLQDGRLLSLDEAGQPRWQQSLGTGGPVWVVADLLEDAGPEIIAGTGGTEPTLALLSAEGRVLWRVAVPSPVGAITSLDLDGDGAAEILAGLSSGEIQVYDRNGRLRGSAHAGLSVWGLHAAEDGSALVLADVAAWKLLGHSGPSGAPWLPPPAMLQLPPDPLPAQANLTGGEVTLVFLGDVVPGRSIEGQLARYGPAYPWTGLGPLLQEADLAVANLESVLTTQGEPLNKLYLIRAHPRWGQVLAEAGLDLVTLANNHALDFGPVGLDETLSTVQALGITTVGAGPSTEIAHRPALFNLDGVRVAVLGYAAARWNGSADVPATDRLAWAEPGAVQDDVRAVRNQVDLVVVLLHAGTEYASTPSADQVAVAHAAIEAGADLVVGHHPHVTQTVERYLDGLIVYSLGDALFDIPRRAAMQGDLLRVHATHQGLAQVELWPFWIEDAIRLRLLDDGTGTPRFRIVYP